MKINNEVQWDCTDASVSVFPEIQAPTKLSFEQAMANLPRNDEGENFYAEMRADADRLHAIRNGEDAGLAEELANNPWLTKETIIAALKRSEARLADAGF